MSGQTAEVLAPREEAGAAPDYEVVVIGAGVAGIYQIKRLKTSASAPSSSKPTPTSVAPGTTTVIPERASIRRASRTATRSRANCWTGGTGPSSSRPNRRPSATCTTSSTGSGCASLLHRLRRVHGRHGPDRHPGTGRASAAGQVGRRPGDLPRPHGRRLPQPGHAWRPAGRRDELPPRPGAGRRLGDALLEYLWTHGYRRFDAEEAAEAEWFEHVKEMYEGPLLRTAKSRITGYNSNLDGHEYGKTRYIIYNGGGPKYARRLREMVANDYGGVTFK